MAHKYENDIPDGDSTTQGQAHYDVDKIYDQSRWENINHLREKIITMLDADKNNVPTSGPSVTYYFSSNSAELFYIEQKVPIEGDREHIYWSGCNFFFANVVPILVFNTRQIRSLRVFLLLITIFVLSGI
ncbi:hypothetical protein ARAF_0409 [Arsenophonus endosymbiont of Aleurodicus floccissimus]|uniref:hypothetical protein n=1 Tax=Arsenophonus endosymbiont of Aleurodicus floccissimus TaxID=2152761 RepID=UPI000E6AE911|nr:hypothetical protein [Arsenophonus endosymbiont of Aleurodicus floccissimus]SPP31290.1 hypothetical protein ARAF_0409 [Arsenophonus endosymbiont of Aleurodicus floccissimus]